MKPRTDLAHIGGLAEVDINVGDLVVLEKSEDVLSRAVGSRSGGGVGGDANPDSDGTDDRVLSLALFVVLVLDVFVLEDFLETNDIDRCETNLEILVSKFYKDRNDNNSNDDNDSDDSDDSGDDDGDDCDDSAAVAAAISAFCRCYRTSALPRAPQTLPTTI